MITKFALFTIVAIIATFAAFRLISTEAGARIATTYFVSPTGNDANDGSEQNPWATIRHALPQLAPGDTLYLRDGTYYEHELEINVSGTISQPITIQSYPDERATIDGGIANFKDLSNPAWNLVDGSIGLYRSKQTFSASFIHAWLADHNQQLIEYEDADNLEATYYGPVDGLKPLYIGPGVHLHNNGRIYIRLRNNPNDLSDALGNPIVPLPADDNPNNHVIAISMAEHILRLNGAEHIQIKDITFSYAKRIFDVMNSHHVDLQGCQLNYGTYGFVVRSNVSNWTVHHCKFSNALPQNVHWSDIKNLDGEAAEAYPEFQSAAIEGGLNNWDIHDNIFRDTFDALDLTQGTKDTEVMENSFINTLDDAIELDEGSDNVEVANNMFWQVAAGIGIVRTVENPGDVYIHHNVIDNMAYHRGGRPGNYQEDVLLPWTTFGPFVSHGADQMQSGWKIYNNTILTRKSGYTFYATGPSVITGNPDKYVMNNIFYSHDDRIVYSDDSAASGSSYDGNIVFQNAPGNLPFFQDFGDGDNYDSLAEFRADSGTNWETRGLQTDPRFNQQIFENPSFDPETIWDMYRPQNLLVFTPGAPYNGLDWPGTEDIQYRGAVPSFCQLEETVLSGICKTYIPFIDLRN